MHSGFTRLIAALSGLAMVPAFAIFQNGGFENGNLTGWTSGARLNNAGGLILPQPFTGASINLTAGGTYRGAVVGAGPDLMGAPITLPRAGSFTARVNNNASNYVANSISQSDVVTAADRDPVDNLLHIRFNYSVVLQNPPHTSREQPFFYLRIRNTTKNTVLLEDFSFAGQTGTQFLPVPSASGWLYLDWKTADVVVPNADLGDTIEVYLLAAGCSQGGHGGYAYLDGFGSAVIVPGPAAILAVNVPTLSEWSLIALGLLLLGAAGYGAKRRT